MDNSNAADQFIGAHVEVLETLTKLQQLAQSAPSFSLDQRTSHARALYGPLTQMLTDHHMDEEQLLFPSMQAQARSSDEEKMIKKLITRLMREHREMESFWAQIRPALKALSSGQHAELPTLHCNALLEHYLAHAQLEETVVLPLAATLLTDGDKNAMELSLTLRHNVRNLAAHI